MNAVTTRIRDGDTVELPTDADVSVAVERQGYATNIFLHAIGDERTETYAVEIHDIESDQTVPTDADHVEVAHVKYNRFVAVTFTQIE